MNPLNLTDLHAIADRSAFDFGSVIELADEDGFIGAGADLSTATLLNAYRTGVFPWFSAGDPICWWCPPIRCVINPNDFRPAKSLIRTAKKSNWQISTNLAFDEVMRACAEPRAYTDETWIVDEMIDAYTRLHELGVAFSVEVWADTPKDSELLGGLYGLQLGSLVCGESMFHRRTDASKIAFWAMTALAKHAGVQLIDCQLENPHLMSLGASLLPKDDFLAQIHTLNRTDTPHIHGRMAVQDLAL
ncbi:leucyl/phenylalanyl-tRNA--protein transferase [Moraxella nasibovis]|uniref:leucyl/phenylalanyl-tRNA--protein transferase n=1 Tax=Moraxella nasibovis TaxID=2904120 RepID=UPI0024108B6A|nr:leucyl/phenylalanyl-tRNA--protein transferase [Moraxella nasibovis]WFF38406.1 leucyl/phenylalanyl-tRNA--protein transferase [Moraxella nasibovis]